MTISIVRPSHINDERPNFIEDFFVLGNRTYIKLKTSPTVYFVIDGEKNICEKVTIKENIDDEERIEGQKIILSRFSVSDLVEYTPIPELHSGSMFSFTYTGIDGLNKKIRTASLDEIVGELKSQGQFIEARKAMDVLTNAINALKINGKYSSENKSPYPGFFNLNGNFVSTKSYQLPNNVQMAEALKIFNDFGEHYTDFAPKLGYIAHWMIMAPFSFVIKQNGKGTKLNNLFLYGTTRTGKTTIASLSCFIWSRIIDEQLSSGSHVHSPYQFGRAISQSSYPIIIDEGEGLFDSPELKSLVKTATHAKSARARYNSNLNREEEIMAFSLSIITSNYSKPDDGALGARIDLIKYTSNDIRSELLRNEFEAIFQPKVDNGPLKALNFIGDYVASQIIADPNLLNENWLDLSKKLWKDMYELAEIEMPEWMVNIESPESVEESFEDEKEHYISNIKALIIRNENVDDYDSEEERYKHHITSREKAQDVVLNSSEPWIQYHNPSSGRDAGKEFVWIEKSIETDLRKDKQINIQLDRIAELLGGKVQRKDTKSGRRSVAVFDYEEFLDLF